MKEEKSRYSRRGFMKLCMAGAAGGFLTYLGVDRLAGSVAAQAGSTGDILTLSGGSNSNPINYLFSVEGSVSKNSDTESSDAIFGNQVAGVLEGGSDVYTINGEIRDFNADSGINVALNGTQVTKQELLQRIGCNTSGSGGSTGDDGSGTGSGGTDTGCGPGAYIGGGEGYPNTVAESDADVVVDNLSELESELESASSGDIVFVPGDAEIDVGSTRIEVPAGVTLASDRGVNGSDGALLETDLHEPDIVFPQEDARVTGLRMKGPSTTWDNADGNADAIKIQEKNVEVDNCEIWGWGHAGVYIDMHADGNAHVHHNYIHDNPQPGLGYGVYLGNDRSVVEYNYFNNNRHSTASCGCPDVIYIVRYNHFGPDSTDHMIDVHDGDNGEGGKELEIRNNIVESTRNHHNVHGRGYEQGEDGKSDAVAIRGTPTDIGRIYDNWFWNPDPPERAGCWCNFAVIQPLADSDEWENLEIYDNYYGEDADVSFSDIIPCHPGPEDRPWA